MPVSIRDVALRAGVSTATVSRVLNNIAVQIAPETRARVEQAARELQYHPSAVARALVRRQTDTLGVVLPPTQESPVRNAFFSALLDGVLEAASQRRLNIMIFTAQVGPGAQRSLAPLRDGRCDGLLVFYQPPDKDILPALLDARIPCVLVCDWRDDPRLPCVDVENRQAARRMTEYLLGLGHRRIALLGSGLYGDFMTDRIRGYRQALEEFGQAADEDLIVTGLEPWDIPSVFRGVQTLMARPASARPTALMCLTDDIAALALAFLHRRGIAVPEEISVTGFNDDNNALRQHPALTTMRQPYVDLGGCAMDILLERGADDTVPARNLRLPTELVVRGSSAPPTTSSTLPKAAPEKKRK